MAFWVLEYRLLLTDVPLMDPAAKSRWKALAKIAAVVGGTLGALTVWHRYQKWREQQQDVLECQQKQDVPRAKVSIGTQCDPAHRPATQRPALADPFHHLAPASEPASLAPTFDVRQSQDGEPDEVAGPAAFDTSVITSFAPSAASSWVQMRDRQQTSDVEDAGTETGHEGGSSLNGEIVRLLAAAPASHQSGESDTGTLTPFSRHSRSPVHYHAPERARHTMDEILALINWTNSDLETVDVNRVVLRAQRGVLARETDFALFTHVTLAPGFSRRDVARACAQVPHLPRQVQDMWTTPSANPLQAPLSPRRILDGARQLRLTSVVGIDVNRWNDLCEKTKDRTASPTERKSRDFDVPGVPRTPLDIVLISKGNRVDLCYEISRAFLWHLKCGEGHNVQDSTELLCFRYLGGRDLTGGVEAPPAAAQALAKVVRVPEEPAPAGAPDTGSPVPADGTGGSFVWPCRYEQQLDSVFATPADDQRRLARDIAMFTSCRREPREAKDQTVCEQRYPYVLERQCGVQLAAFSSAPEALREALEVDRELAARMLPFARPSYANLFYCPSLGELTQLGCSDA